MSLSKKYRYYSPKSSLINAKQFWFEMLYDFRSARNLAWQLTLRDFKAGYRQSFMGYAWALLPPLFASVTFILLRSSGAISTSEPNIPYAAYALVGTLLWQVFADALMQPIRIMNTSTTMLMKINFPREALLLGALQYSLINLSIRLGIISIVLIYFQLPPGYAIVCGAPFAILCLVFLGYAIGVLLAPLACLYKDVQQGLAVIMNFWMLFTPVVFTNARQGIGGVIMSVNPVTYVLPAARNLLTGQQVTVNEFQVLAFIGAITLVLLIIGWLNFRVVLPHIIERLGM